MSEKTKTTILDSFGKAVINLSKFAYLISRYAIKQLPERGILFWVNNLLVFVTLIVWSFRHIHLWILYRVWPEVFSKDVLMWFMQLTPLTHFLYLVGIWLVLNIYFLGHSPLSCVKRFERAFRTTGIKNALGEYPIVLDYSRVSTFRYRLRLLVDGIDADEFNSKSKKLETSFRAMIEGVVRHDSPQYVDIYLTSNPIPKKVMYADVSAKLTSPYTFIIGETLADTMTFSICSLPHMLIAGATGTGKSVFQKQMLLGLLEGTRSGLQVYILDLKRGLEMKQFTVCRNVLIVKEVSEAVILLRELSSEMDRRFRLLEEKGFNQINPDRDKLDRIVVCIDEASVLYTESKLNTIEKELTQEATEITDRIAKLSRATGIHLIFATQKVTKDTISTHIQENLEGRMCFEVNTLQGSNMVIGSGEAKELPHIPGRGLWKVGATVTEVQTPYVDDEEIKRRCLAIENEFKSKKRMTYQPMISPEKTTESSNQAVNTFTSGKSESENG